MADRKPTVLNPAGYQENLQDTDNLVVEAAPTAENHAVNKGFIDDLKTEIDGDIADAGKWEESSGKLYPKDLTNKVGIGLDNPSVPLQVNSAGGTQIRLQDTRNANRFGDIQTTGSLYLTARLDDQRGAIVFRGRNDVDTIEYGRWTGSGRFGIGTDAPSNGLHVVATGAPLNTSAKFESTSNNSYINFVDPSGTTFIGNNGNDTKFLQGSGATERMRITSAGDVGIGTASPESKLDIKLDALANNTSAAVITIGDNGNHTPQIYLDRYQNANNYGLSFHVGAGTRFEAVRITNLGNVGIGTDSPSQKLDVAGNGAFSGNVTIDGYALTPKFYTDFIYSRDLGGDLVLGARTSGGTEVDVVTITDNGRVGIGTNTPTEKLSIVEQVDDTVGSGKLLSLGVRGTSNSIRQLNFYGPGPDSQRVAKIAVENTAAPFAIDVNSAERLRITGDGDVGIGIPSPTAKLDVYAGSLGTTLDDELNIGRFWCTDGNASKLNIFEKRFKAGTSWESASLRLQREVDATPMGYVEFGAGKPTGTASLDVSIGAGTTEIARFANGGNVGIGTDAPGRTLHVNSTAFNTVRIQSSQTGSRIEFQDSGTASHDTVSIGSDGNDFQINTNTAGGGIRRVTVKEDGNVGIGTYSPAEKLEVLGNIGIGRVNGGYRFLETTNGDLRGGMVSTSANDVQILTGGGTLNTHFDANGNVGIGTSNPIDGRGPLHLHSSNNTTNIHLTNNNSGAGSQDGLTVFMEGANSAGLWYRENAPFRIATNNSEKVRIEAGGNVGIGTQAPGSKLHLKSSGATTTHIETVRTGDTFNNSGILFSTPRSNSVDGGSHGGRGALVNIGNPSNAGGIQWLLAATAGLSTSETDADYKTKQCGLRLDSSGNMELWSNSNKNFKVDNVGTLTVNGYNIDALPALP